MASKIVRCECEPCHMSADYGLPGTQRTRCNTHKTEGMHMLCRTASCGKIAKYGANDHILNACYDHKWPCMRIRSDTCSYGQCLGYTKSKYCSLHYIHEDPVLVITGTVDHGLILLNWDPKRSAFVLPSELRQVQSQSPDAQRDTAFTL